MSVSEFHSEDCVCNDCLELTGKNKIKTPKKKVVSNVGGSKWVSVVVLAGFVIALALWDSGWKPQTAFLAGFAFMFTPGVILSLYRFWVRRESLVASYDQAKLLFRAAKLNKQEEQRKKEKKSKIKEKK